MKFDNLLLNIMDFQNTSKQLKSQKIQQLLLQPQPTMAELSSEEINESETKIFNVDQEIRKLLGRTRFYLKEKWMREITYNRILTDFQSTYLQLHYGPYAIQISIINIQYEYNFEKITNYIGQGQFGKVSLCEYDNQICAVKMVKFSQKNNEEEIRSIYKEYFIALLASELRVGPRLINLFGAYSIVFLKNCALFSMQVCEKLGAKNLPLQSLKQSLNVLHSMHIVHCDIKPDNIAWSFTYQKYVFIDFGLSLIVRENSNQKSFTEFAGSYKYSSPEMRKLFLLKMPGEVNLYENDLFSFQKCKAVYLNHLFQTSIFTRVQKQKESSFIESLAFTLRLKQKLSRNQFKEIQFLILTNQSLLKTCFYIIDQFCEKNYPKFFDLTPWMQLRRKLRQKILCKNLVCSEFDQIIYQSLQKKYMRNEWQDFLESLKHLEKSIEFCKGNQLWLKRIYYMINPINYSGQTMEQLKQNSYQVVNKIYKALKLKPTWIFLKKLREVELFFVNKFMKLKNRMILESMSNIFLIIHDPGTCVKIRKYILSITQDHVQFCLQSLNFHLLQQNFYFFNRVISTEYLQGVKQRIKNQPNLSNIDVINVIMRIIQNIQQLTNFIHETDIKILDQISILITELRDILQKNEIFMRKIAYRIKTRWSYLSSSAVELIKKVTNRHYMIKNKNIIRYNHYREDQIIGLTNQNIVNKSFYIQVIKNYFQPIAPCNPAEKQQYIRCYEEYVVFYEGMIQGNFHFVNFKQIFCQNYSRFANQSVVYLVLREKIRYLDTVDKIVQGVDFQKIFSYLVSLILNLLNALWVEKKQNRISLKWFNEKDQDKYFQLMSLCLSKIIEEIQKYIVKEYQRNILYFLIQIHELLKKCYHLQEECEEKMVKQIENLYIEVQKWQSAHEVLIKQERAHFLFFHVVSFIITIMKNAQKISQVETMFLKFYYELKNNIRILISYPVLYTFIQTLLKKQRSLDSFHIIQQLIKYDIDNQDTDTYDINYKTHFPKIIKQFFKRASLQDIQHCQNIIKEKSREELKIFMSHGCGSYFVSWILYKFHEQKQLVEKYLHKILLNLQYFHNGAKIQIINLTFRFTIGRLANCNRKYYVSVKKILRFLLISSQNNSSQYVINYLISKSKKWPIKIRNKIHMRGEKIHQNYKQVQKFVLMKIQHEK